MLGLKINLSESKIVLLGDVGDVVFGCGVASLPMKYLGLPLGVSYKEASTIWNDIIEKIEHRLAGWKDVLSKGGRLTFIQSTIFTNILCLFSLFW
jgi:hypothetical protein